MPHDCPLFNLSKQLPVDQLLWHDSGYLYYYYALKISVEMTMQAAPDADKTVVFSAKGVTKVYKMGDVDVHALRGVDLELYEGEFVVFLGASGSGKSTLLNILGGLDTATDGVVSYRGKELAHASERELTDYRRHHVGFVFQFYNLIPSLTAEENVEVVTEIADNPMSVTDALDIVGLSDRSDHFPAQLSGGQQQRVAIARAIAKKPKVLLCDEPTGALDSKTGIVVLKALQQVNQQLGTTTAVITHNADIADIADRVVELTDGRISDIRINTQRKKLSEVQW